MSTGIQEEPKSAVTLFKLKKGGLQGRDLKNNRMFNNFLIIEKKAKLKKSQRMRSSKKRRKNKTQGGNNERTKFNNLTEDNFYGYESFNKCFGN